MIGFVMMIVILELAKVRIILSKLYIEILILMSIKSVGFGLGVMIWKFSVNWFGLFCILAAFCLWFMSLIIFIPRPEKKE